MLCIIDTNRGDYETWKYVALAGHRRAMDQGRQDGHPLDPALLPSVPGQRGAVAARRRRLRPRQFAAPTRSPRRHPKLVPDEPPAALVQDRWAAHSPRPVLHLTARRKQLDRVSLSPDPARIEGLTWHPT